jgi:hypothetical protein
MGTTGIAILVIGFVCIVAAIVGGNLKLAGASFGALREPPLRVGLAIAGIVAVWASFNVANWIDPAPSMSDYLSEVRVTCSAARVTEPPSTIFRQTPEYYRAKATWTANLVAELRALRPPKVNADTFDVLWNYLSDAVNQFNKIAGNLADAPVANGDPLNSQLNNSLMQLNDSFLAETNAAYLLEAKGIGVDQDLSNCWPS